MARSLHPRSLRKSRYGPQGPRREDSLSWWQERQETSKTSETVRIAPVQHLCTGGWAFRLPLHGSRVLGSHPLLELYCGRALSLEGCCLNSVGSRYTVVLELVLSLTVRVGQYYARGVHVRSVGDRKSDSYLCRSRSIDTSHNRGYHVLVIYSFYRCRRCDRDGWCRISKAAVDS